MDAAAAGLTSDQKNNMKYSTRLKVFYHLNIGKGIMLLDSDRRRTVRLETVGDTAAVSEYFHFIKPESPFLNAIVLSPFCLRWRAEHCPGWWYHYVDIVLRSAALRSPLYVWLPGNSFCQKHETFSAKAGRSTSFFLFTGKTKRKQRSTKIFLTLQSALQFCNDLSTELPHLVTSSLFPPIMCMAAWRCVISKQQFCRISNKTASISFRTFYLHWLVYEVDHTWEMEQHWDHMKTSNSMHNTAPGGHSLVLQFVLNVLG